MKTAIMAIVLSIGLFGCKRDEKREAYRAEQARQDQAVRDANKANNDASDKVKEESRQTSRDISEGAEAAKNKVAEETRQTSRDIGEGVDKAASKTREETRQTSRDIAEAFKGDKATTEADKQLNIRIRSALKNDKDVADETDNIKLITDHGKVRIQGTVDSREDLHKISTIAREVAGLTHVDNDMKTAKRVSSGPSD